MLHENQVTVPKTTLLERLRENRSKHVVDYTEACAGYRTELRKLAVALEARIDEKRELDTLIGQIVHLPRPESHLKEYDRVIAMLEMSTSDDVTLTTLQFANYALDEWSWKSQFLSTTSSYK